MSSAFATVVLERIFDGIALICLLFFVFIFIDFPDWLKRLGYLAIAIFAGSLLVLIMMLIFRRGTENIISFLFNKISPSITKKILNIMNGFVEGLRSLPSFKAILTIIAHTLCIYVLLGIMNYCIFLAFNQNLPFIASYTVLAVLSIGLMIPAGPAFIGNYHFFCILALQAFNVDKASALSIAIFLHSIGILSTILLGCSFLILNRISFSALFSTNKKSVT